MIRTATIEESGALAKLINDAFVVEAFFKIGDRTNATEIAEVIESGGEFLVIDDPESGSMAGCVYLKCAGDRSYFGMLSIDPPRQRRGLGRRLIDAAEARARQQGCRFMDIHIVNLREELFPYYGRLGYVVNGTLPFSEPSKASQPCSFVVMSKIL